MPSPSRGIDSPEQLWQALRAAMTSSPKIPPDRWNADEYYDPQAGGAGSVGDEWAGFLDDVAGFDSRVLRDQRARGTAIDPQHRLLLETPGRQWSMPGLTRDTMTGSLTSVFVGLTHGDYQLMAADAHAVEAPYGFTGSSFKLGVRADRVRPGDSRSRADGGTPRVRPV